MSVKRNDGTYFRDYTLTEEAKQNYRIAYGYTADEFLT
jgi:hypothetical protein